MVYFFDSLRRQLSVYSGLMKLSSTAGWTPGLLALFCCPLLITSCASVASIAGDATHNFDPPKHNKIPRVYSGVATDLSFIREAPEDVGLSIIDLPLSAVVDTFALPYTAVRQSKYGNLYDPGPN
jgi:uncharacterized protein YceK